MEKGQAKASLYRILDEYPDSVGYLIGQIEAGKIDGGNWTDRKKQGCGCIFFHIEQFFDEDFGWAEETSERFTEREKRRGHTDFEEHILTVEIGETHETSPVLKDVRDWLLEYKAEKGLG